MLRSLFAKYIYLTQIFSDHIIKYIKFLLLDGGI